MSMSSTFDSDPTATNIFLAVLRKMRTARVECPTVFGRSAMCCGDALAFKSPLWYAKRNYFGLYYPTYNHCGSGPGG